MAEQAQPNNRPPNGQADRRPERNGDKHEEKKEDKGTADERAKRFMAEAIGVCILLLIAGRLFGYFVTNGTFTPEKALNALYSSSAWPYIQGILVTYITVANVLSLFFITFIAFSLIRVRQYQRIWYAMINPEETEAIIVPEKNERWQRVLEHSASDNPSDWRLAVLEADIILDELLDHEGYAGDTIGDKLKKAVLGDFQTLNYAWEAHRIRNAIAHEGQDFVLTQREARRILGLYEMVFREFNFI